MGTITVSYTNGIGIDVGAETTVDSGLPRTHLWDIVWLKNDGTWKFWALADFLGEVLSNSPLWILNCSPNYRHIHVGSGATGDCN